MAQNRCLISFHFIYYFTGYEKSSYKTKQTLKVQIGARLFFPSSLGLNCFEWKKKQDSCTIIMVYWCGFRWSIVVFKKVFVFIVLFPSQARQLRVKLESTTPPPRPRKQQLGRSWSAALSGCFIILGIAISAMIFMLLKLIRI